MIFFTPLSFDDGGIAVLSTFGTLLVGSLFCSLDELSLSEHPENNPKTKKTNDRYFKIILNLLLEFVYSLQWPLTRMFTS